MSSKKEKTNEVKPLTGKENTSIPFELCFKYKLDKKYNFERLQQNQIKQFQAFLDEISQMNEFQVLQMKKRTNDKNDIYEGSQVIHFEVKDCFRIHTIKEGNHYVVIRIDPNHKVHDK